MVGTPKRCEENGNQRSFGTKGRKCLPRPHSDTAEVLLYSSSLSFVTITPQKLTVFPTNFTLLTYLLDCLTYLYSLFLGFNDASIPEVIRHSQLQAIENVFEYPDCRTVVSYIAKAFINHKRAVSNQRMSIRVTQPQYVQEPADLGTYTWII